MKHPHKKIGTLILSIIIVIALTVSGCTSQSPPTINNTPTTTPTPTPTPQIHTIPPYMLDEEGYYIADDRTWDRYYRNGSENTHSVFEFLGPANYESNSGGPIFNVTLKNANITSGEALVFEGTTTIPSGATIPILIGDQITHQKSESGPNTYKWFSAHVLPGANGTNLIKVKIPAINIHIDEWYRHEREFPEGAIYENLILFGLDRYIFTITSDPKYPMIWEATPGTRHIWVWTNDTATEHTSSYLSSTPSTVQHHLV
jgi:hypothetical protein